MAFQRKRKGVTDPFFTYYVGPKYSGKNSLFLGGNAAHLLEYGTVERFRANKAQGGIGKTVKGKRTGVSRLYGATSSTGKIQRPTVGVLRQSFDEYKNIGMSILRERVYKAILEKAKKEGLAA